MTEEEKRVTAAADHVQRTIDDLLATMQELDRRDHRMMVTMCDKYGIPQRMSNNMQAVSDYTAAVKAALAAGTR